MKKTYKEITSWQKFQLMGKLFRDRHDSGQGGWWASCSCCGFTPQKNMSVKNNIVFSIANKDDYSEFDLSGLLNALNSRMKFTVSMANCRISTKVLLLNRRFNHKLKITPKWWTSFRARSKTHNPLWKICMRYKTRETKIDNNFCRKCKWERIILGNYLKRSTSKRKSRNV